MAKNDGTLKPPYTRCQNLEGVLGYPGKALPGKGKPRCGCPHGEAVHDPIFRDRTHPRPDQSVQADAAKP
jgi:hypothetical protein